MTEIGEGKVGFWKKLKKKRNIRVLPFQAGNSKGMVRKEDWNFIYSNIFLIYWKKGNEY